MNETPKQFHVVQIENGWLVTAVKQDFSQPGNQKQTVTYCRDKEAVAVTLGELM